MNESTMNEKARSRRRLLRALGGSGAALGAVLAADWCKPVVKSVMLPVHAQTSASSCSVSVTGAFTASGVVNYSLTASASRAGSVYLSTSVSGAGDSASVSVAGTLPPGSTYDLGMFVSVGPSASVTYAVTASCCNGRSRSASASAPLLSSGVSITADIADDGTCTLPAA